MESAPSSHSTEPSLSQGRWCILVATLLWSLGGAFFKLLTRDTSLGLNTPTIDPASVAFYRLLFAGLVLLPTLRRCDLSFRPMMIVMLLFFAAMNALYVRAMILGTAADAILLQYTAPMWMYLASVCWLGESADRRGLLALSIGLVGIAVIVAGSFTRPAADSGASNATVIALGLSSGVTYAGVMICLRVLRNASSRWLTVINHLGGALLLSVDVWGRPVPSGPQLAVLALFGAIQMALPYWLVARGLRVVSPQEAAVITLLEPILNPIGAYLVSGETPSVSTFAGGLFIVGALAWRYWPRKRTSVTADPPRNG